MKLRATSCRATQDRLVMVESSVHWRRKWQTTSTFLPWHPHDSRKRLNVMTLKDELPRWVGAQYVTGEERRNSSKRNEETEPKWKQCPVVDVSGGKDKVWSYKEKCCIGTWNVRTMNQVKLEVVKQEMARMNINILGISELMDCDGQISLTWPLYLLVWARIP